MQDDSGGSSVGLSVVNRGGVSQNTMHNLHVPEDRSCWRGDALARHRVLGSAAGQGSPLPGFGHHLRAPHGRGLRARGQAIFPPAGEVLSEDGGGASKAGTPRNSTRLGRRRARPEVVIFVQGSSRGLSSWIGPRIILRLFPFRLRLQCMFRAARGFPAMSVDSGESPVSLSPPSRGHGGACAAPRVACGRAHSNRVSSGLQGLWVRRVLRVL